ncbi:hypothetical protein [Corynebacterium propinquum]|nr:hypothetical protein [Corynebacterium propinquum]
MIISTSLTRCGDTQRIPSVRDKRTKTGTACAVPVLQGVADD